MDDQPFVGHMLESIFPSVLDRIRREAYFQAQVILDEILILDSLPGIDDSGQIKSTLRDKLTREYQDCQALATALGTWQAAATTRGRIFCPCSCRPPIK